MNIEPYYAGYKAKYACMFTFVNAKYQIAFKSLGYISFLYYIYIENKSNIGNAYIMPFQYW